ncbi:MAG: histidine kinase dimerization/phospho-acceptor domain-containing protein, partial [Thermodesulfovibrionales bacterium]
MGSSIRFSDTLKEDLLYVAKRVGPETRPAGFVRLAIPLTEVQKEINALRLRIVFAVVFVLVATGGLIMWQAEKIRAFVLQITEYSRGLAKGAFGKRLMLRESGELGEIAGNLNSMAEELSVFVERSLEETDRMNATLRSIPDALLILDSEGKIQISNDTAKGYFVASDTPLKGKSFMEVVRAPEFFSLIDEIKRNKIAGFTEFRIEYPKERILSVRVSPLLHKEDAVGGFVALFHDTTLIRRLEDARKDFVANVSHEIKTPVTAIHGFAEALIDEALDDRETAMRFLGIIRTHTER